MAAVHLLVLYPAGGRLPALQPPACAARRHAAGRRGAGVGGDHGGAAGGPDPVGRFDVPGDGHPSVLLAAAAAGPLSAPVGAAGLRGTVRPDPAAGKGPCSRVFRGPGDAVSHRAPGKLPGLSGGGIRLGGLFPPAAVGVFVWRGVVPPCRLALRGGERSAEAKAVPGFGVDGTAFPAALPSPSACAVRRVAGGGKLDKISKRAIPFGMALLNAGNKNQRLEN